MKSRTSRLLGTVRLGPDGRVGQIVNVASQEGSPIIAMQWADDGSVTWHRPDELTRE